MARQHRRRAAAPEEFAEVSAGTGGDRGEVIEFDPAAPQGGADSGPQIEETPESVDTITLSENWLEAQEELEERLGGDEALMAALAEEAVDYTSSVERVLGTGIGFRTMDGLLSAEVALKVYVTEKAPPGTASALAAVPSDVGGLPVDVEAVGDIAPQIYNRRYPRPVRCGVSIGHPRVTAGTLGCLVVLNNNRLCLLSNNHVIADSNNARLGDPIIQPGRADGGSAPADRIAALENFVRINFPGPNLVDAAVAWTSFANVDPRHVTYILNPNPVAARLGMTVKKNGRTTQATIGTVTDVNVNISVGYSGGVAQFRNQIGIRGVGGVFSRGGDSGSLIVTASSNQPVALLFAGRRDNTLTFANPIGPVCQLLGIRRFVHQR